MHGIHLSLAANGPDGTLPYEDDVGTQDHWTNRCLHTSAHRG